MEVSSLELSAFRGFLRRLRKSRSMTLEEVQSVTGIPTSTLSRIERGEIHEPKWGDVLLLAKAYKVSADYLALVSGVDLELVSGVRLPPGVWEAVSRLNEIDDDPAELYFVKSLVESLVNTYMDNRYYLFPPLEDNGEEQGSAS